MPEDLRSVRAERDELARAALSVLKDLDALLDGRNKDHKPLLWQEYARMRQELREALAYRAEGPDGVEERESIAQVAVDALDLPARDARVRAEERERACAELVRFGEAQTKLTLDGFNALVSIAPAVVRGDWDWLGGQPDTEGAAR